jgi:hypothetical protein
MIELLPEIEHKLREKAALSGQDVNDLLRPFLDAPLSQNGIRQYAGGVERPREADPSYLLSLPKAERDRIMTAQFDAAAPLYAADLALPVEQRELTAFTALDDDPILEDCPVD